MQQPLVELGGEPTSPTLHLALANGFPPETYIPFLRPLISQYRIVSLPPRALWGGQNPPTEFVDWSHLSDDLLAGMVDYELNDVIAVGHSFGAIASLVAVLKDPQRFRGLIMLDPTILPPSVIEMIRVAKEQGVQNLHPLAQKAARRRTEFDSAEQLYNVLREKPLFQDWDDEAMHNYAEYGTVPRKGDSGMTLRWSSMWEAYYFSTMRLGIWEDLPGLDGLLPILILRGQTTDVFIEESANLVQTILPDATIITIDGHGHLFPHTAPRKTAELIQRWLRQQGL